MSLSDTQISMSGGQECRNAILAYSVVSKHNLNSDSNTLAASLEASDCARVCAIAGMNLPNYRTLVLRLDLYVWCVICLWIKNSRP